MSQGSNWLPSLKSAVMQWATLTKVYVSGKREFDYKTEETYYEYSMKIFRVPSGQSLEMKPEGQRAWNTENIYTDTKYDMSVDDIIRFDDSDSEKFRIVNKTNWNKFGFIEYQIVSDYI